MTIEIINGIVRTLIAIIALIMQIRDAKHKKRLQNRNYRRG